MGYTCMHSVLWDATSSGGLHTSGIHDAGEPVMSVTMFCMPSGVLTSAINASIMLQSSHDGVMWHLLSTGTSISSFNAAGKSILVSNTNSVWRYYRGILGIQTSGVVTPVNDILGGTLTVHIMTKGG